MLFQKCHAGPFPGQFDMKDTGVRHGSTIVDACLRLRKKRIMIWDTDEGYSNHNTCSLSFRILINDTSALFRPGINYISIIKL